MPLGFYFFCRLQLSDLRVIVKEATSRFVITFERTTINLCVDLIYAETSRKMEKRNYECILWHLNKIYILQK